MIAPWVLGFIAFTLGPMIYSLYVKKWVFGAGQVKPDAKLTVTISTIELV